MTVLRQVLIRCAAAIVVLGTPIFFVLYRGNVDQSIFFGMTQLHGIDQSINSEETKKYQLEDYSSLQDISKQLKDYWLYFRAIINQTNRQDQLENVDDGYVAVDSIVQNLIERSETARGKRIKQMSDFVRNEIYRLQHPENCDKAKLAVADMTVHNCGFGCTSHTVVKFLMTTFMENRTLVLKSAGWGYANEGWDFAFLPLSSCEHEGDIKSLPVLKATTRNEPVVMLPQRTERWMPWSVPKELESTLKRLHGHPYAWWISQFTSYALRKQPWLEKELQKQAEEIGFHESAVGIQVRWGDKLKEEANKHEVQEYMSFVEKWHQQLENRGNIVNKTVYLASEESEVWMQMRQKYPDYNFIGVGPMNQKHKFRHRYKHDGLISVVSDIYFLSRCSYLVCTLSSSVCRTAYEMMMNRWSDASTRIQSVDSPYRLKSIERQPWEAVMAHSATVPGEIALEKGDMVEVALDPHLPFNDGFFRGTNKRTGKEGKFPTYKVREVVSTYARNAFIGAWKSQDV